MEDILFGAAVAFFIAAAVFAVASVVAFRKLEVADAIRFLRHRTAAQGVGLVGVLAHKPKERKAKAADLDRDTAPSIARKKGKHERATEDKDGTAAEASESPTTLLVDPGVSASAEVTESERPTSLLACEDSEKPTELLSLGDDSGQMGPAVDSSGSENPTELLAIDGDSENPTEVLWLDEESEGAASMLAASPVPDSDNPTKLLSPIESLPQEDSPRQTICLEPLDVGAYQDDGASDVGASTCDESTFWFRMKQSQMSIHTDEVIGQ